MIVLKWSYNTKLLRESLPCFSVFNGNTASLLCCLSVSFTHRDSRLYCACSATDRNLHIFVCQSSWAQTEAALSAFLKLGNLYCSGYKGHLTAKTIEISPSFLHGQIVMVSKKFWFNSWCKHNFFWWRLEVTCLIFSISSLFLCNSSRLKTKQKREWILDLRWTSPWL